MLPMIGSDCKLERMRHTKIIATIGPASSSDAVLDGLIAAGVDICRLNFSHGTHESQAETYRRVREAAARAGRDVAILQDLSGPKIRTGRLAGGRPLDLQRRQHAADRHRGRRGRTRTRLHDVRGAGALGPAGRPRCCSTTGAIELRVIEASGTEIVTTVVDGGSLGEHKGINAPGVVLPASAVTLEGRGRPAVRPLARRRPRGAQLRAERRRSPSRPGGHDLGRRERRAAHREDRAAGGDRAPRGDPRRRATG